MEKYIIKISIFNSEINGRRNSNSYNKEFKESSLIQSRNKAIDEVKRITSLATSDKNYFCPLFDEKMSKTNNFNFFLVDLIFSPRKGVEYKIFGEKSIMYSSLGEEGNYYKHRINNQPLVEININGGKKIEVLKSNFDFFFDY